MAAGDIYETDESLAQYLLFHYGAPAEQMPWSFGPMRALDYPVRTVTELLEPQKLPSGARALDLGCAVGRSSFELARHCSEVVGIDFSQRFVDAAETLRVKGQLAYMFVVEGAIRQSAIAQRPEEIDPARLRFEQGDAMHLHSGLGEFDVVHLANLIDRLVDPSRCLDQLPRLLRPGGQLLISSPFTWLAEFTPPDRWIGGSATGETASALKSRLAPTFVCDREVDLPFVIREHVRKYQWSVAWGARFLRR